MWISSLLSILSFSQLQTPAPVSNQQLNSSTRHLTVTFYSQVWDYHLFLDSVYSSGVCVYFDSKLSQLPQLDNEMTSDIGCPSTWLFFFNTLSWLFGSFAFPQKFQNQLVHVFKNPAEILIRSALILQITLQNEY